MKGRLLMLAVLLSTPISGCTTTRAFFRGEDVAKVGLGEAFAQAHCARCHAIDGIGKSPDPEAPSFRGLADRYVGDSLIWELEASAAVGHYDMPAIATRAADREALSAYIASLNSQPRRRDP